METRYRFCRIQAAALVIGGIACAAHLHGQEAPARFDRLLTRGGSALHGRFQGVNGGKFAFKDNDLGDIRFTPDRVLSLDLAVPFDVYFQRSAREDVRHGVMRLDESGYVVDEVDEADKDDGDTFRLDPAGFTNLGRAPYSIWSLGGNVGVSLTQYDGNNENLLYGANFDFKLMHPWHEATAKGEGAYAENEGRRTTQRGRALADYVYRFTEPLGAFVRENLDHDDFQNLRVKAITSAGLAGYLLRDGPFTWRLDAGASYTKENRSRGLADREFYGAALTSETEWKVNDVLRLTTVARANISLERADNFTTQSEFGAHLNLGTVCPGLTVAFLLQHDYVATPPGELERSDYRYILRVGWCFSA